MTLISHSKRTVRVSLHVSVLPRSALFPSATPTMGSTKQPLMDTHRLLLVLSQHPVLCRNVPCFVATSRAPPPTMANTAPTSSSLGAALKETIPLCVAVFVIPLPFIACHGLLTGDDRGDLSLDANCKTFTSTVARTMPRIAVVQAWATVAILSIRAACFAVE